MVRFSDILGDAGEPEDAVPSDAGGAGDTVDPSSPFAALQDLDAEARDETPDGPGPNEPEVESPRDVLDRLTRYATSARAADQATATIPPTVPTVPVAETKPDSEPETVSAEPTNVDDLTPVADDLLPKRRP